MIKYLIISLLIFMPGFSLAQEQTLTEEVEEEESKSVPRPFLFAGVSAGGHADRGNFIYRDGYHVNGGVLWKRNKRVHLGFGVGLEKLNSELFLPAGLMALGYTKKDDESMYFGLHAGYALGIRNDLYSHLNYEYHGGLFFQPMLGYKFGLKGSDLLIGISYKHQFAGIRYERPDGGHFSEENNYHIFSFRAGIVF